jgi:hypothetical protein
LSSPSPFDTIRGMAMHEQGFYAPRPETKNPFLSSSAETSAETQYTELRNTLVRKFVYDTEELHLKEIDAQVGPALRIPRLQGLEQERHALEILLHFLKGMAQHELANAIQNRAWQAELMRQNALGGERKSPEELSREDVAKIFEKFQFKEDLLKAEAQMIEWYGRILTFDPEAKIRITEHISIDATDIESLMIDVQVRAAERIADAEARRQKLQELDKQLADVIQKLPPGFETRGKRSELEEIYLLRRLIHAADVGHLVSVSPAPPRYDLRPDFGSVDFEIAAAGSLYQFQIKTLKREASPEARAKQHQVTKKEGQRLKEASTHFVVLDTKLIDTAYEVSLKQDWQTGTTIKDKYQSLEPLLLEIGAEGSELLAKLLLPHDKLKVEERAVRAREAELSRIQQFQKEKLQEEERRMAEQAARLAEERRLEEEGERTKRQAVEDQQRAAEQESIRREKERAEALNEKRRAMDAKLAEAAKREQEKRAEEQRLAEEEAKKEARRVKKLEKESIYWPPKTMAGLAKPELLRQMGLLPMDWKNDALMLLNAKKQFFKLFAKPKKGASVGTEADKPNDAFKKAFPTKESLESPTDEDIARWKVFLMAA